MTLPLAALTAALVLLGAATPPPRADAAADQVKAADVALAGAVAQHDTGAFAALLEVDVVFANAGGLHLGRDGVVAAWRPYFTPGGPTLAWRPESAIVASSGDLAVTTGRYTWNGIVDGKSERAEGEYVTVWRLGADQRWRVVIDASLEPAAALGPGLAREPLRSASSRAGDLEATLGRWKRGADEGAYVVVRRNAAPERIAVDSAFPFVPKAT